jgi:hypothetical protein
VLQAVVEAHQLAQEVAEVQVVEDLLIYLEVVEVVPLEQILRFLLLILLLQTRV